MHRLFSYSVSNLQEKWRDSFHFLNTNNDDVLDLADVTLNQENYVRLHNLTAEEVCAERETMHETFEEHTRTNVGVFDIYITVSQELLCAMFRLSICSIYLCTRVS